MEASHIQPIKCEDVVQAELKEIKKAIAQLITLNDRILHEIMEVKEMDGESIEEDEDLE